MNGTNDMWLSRTVICKNGVVEKTKYFVRVPEGSTKKQRKKEITRAYRASDNAERELARWLNNNFTPGEDMHLLLTYSDEGMERVKARADKLAPGGSDNTDVLFMAAQKELENWVRRVQYVTKDLCYIGITSDLDGDTGKPCRLHHHVIINRAAFAACVQKWERVGLVLTEELFHTNGDFTPLAHYLISQVRYIPNAKRYTLSRNLTPPETSAPVEVTRYGENEIRVPKGCQLLYRAPYTRGASQYIRFINPALKPVQETIKPPGAGAGKVFSAE